MSNVPINAVEELAHASPRRISFQIRWELHAVIARPEVGTQETLSIDFLRRQDSTVVSKWVNGRAPLPRSVAVKLDALFGDTDLGVPWVALVDALATAEAEHGKTRHGEIHDVFLASPMMAAWSAGTYEEERRRALDLRSALEAYLKLDVYYAGQNIYNDDDFDVPDLAVEMNFDALRESRYFVLLNAAATVEEPEPEPEPTPTIPAAPSSVWVEAGYALAVRKPSLYFVRETRMLPYCLRGPGLAAPGDLLPPVLVHQIRDSAQAGSIIRKQGEQLFTQLDRLKVR